jgi:predicted ATPase
VTFVDLASLISPDLLAHSVAAQVGLLEQPAQPIRATLMDALRSKQCLLVLDNCEHLVGACAVLAHELLVSCPGVRILATSREPLRVAGEQIWRVPSLEVPKPAFDFDQIADADAVRLFIERARAVQSGFELNVENAGTVVEVCRRLDGIPLALELAAARVSMLAVRQIAERLDDVLGLLVSGSRVAPRASKPCAPLWTGVTAC